MILVPLWQSQKRTDVVSLRIVVISLMMEGQVLIGLDLGGTLSKISFCFREEVTHEIPYLEKIDFNVGVSRRTMHFNCFDKAEECFVFITTHLIHRYPLSIAVTGGGGYKYRAELLALHPIIHDVNEFQSLVKGLKFIADQGIRVNATTFSNNYTNSSSALVISSQTHLKEISEFLPCLLVNIGSGVSTLKVTHPVGKADYGFQRIGGTSLGGGFFMGLIKVLTGQNSFDKTMAQMKSIDHQQEGSLRVGTHQFGKEVFNQQSKSQSILGKGQQSQSQQRNLRKNQCGNSSNQTAVSCTQQCECEYRKKLDLSSSTTDLSKSIHNLVFNNILQIALYSSNNHNITHIIFTGSFARNNPFLLKCFGETLKETYRGQLVTKTLVSLGNKDGYLGAIGAVCCLLAKSKEGDGL